MSSVCRAGETPRVVTKAAGEPGDRNRRTLSGAAAPAPSLRGMRTGTRGSSGCGTRVPRNTVSSVMAGYEGLCGGGGRRRDPRVLVTVAQAFVPVSSLLYSRETYAAAYCA